MTGRHSRSGFAVHGALRNGICQCHRLPRGRPDRTRRSTVPSKVPSSSIVTMKRPLSARSFESAPRNGTPTSPHNATNPRVLLSRRHEFVRSQAPGLMGVALDIFPVRFDTILFVALLPSQCVQTTQPLLLVPNVHTTVHVSTTHTHDYLVRASNEFASPLGTPHAPRASAQVKLRGRSRAGAAAMQHHGRPLRHLQSEHA